MMPSLRVALLLALLVASPASAQVSNLPLDLQKTMAGIGSATLGDRRTNNAATLSAFRAILSTAPKAGVEVTPDQPYGADAKQVLDVYRPVARVGVAPGGAPVLVFIHGGAYAFGDKNADGEVHANVGYWFARQGVVTLNANYRLAPATTWPGAVDDVRAVVRWARDNAARFGGDPAQIFIMGHSAGATHVAGYVFDRALQPDDGPGVAGAILISGRYRVIDDPTDPNAVPMRAYFGSDPAEYPNRSPITHVRTAGPTPVFVVISEHENPGLDLRGAELLTALCERDSACPRFMRLLGHTHVSQVAAFNTADEQLGREALDFMRRRR